MNVSQFVYAWGGEGTKRGYQVIAATSDIPKNDLVFFAMNAFPVSFSTGDFENALRVYLLPSGRLCFSYIAPAGQDLLGRSGTYYNHSIVAERTEFTIESISISDILSQFVVDQREISFLIQSFKGDIIQLPKINVSHNNNVQEPVTFFKSPKALALLLQHILGGGSRIILASNNVREGMNCVGIMDALWQIIPREIGFLPFTSFSNNYQGDYVLFKIVFVEQSRMSNGQFPSTQFLLIDPSGSYFPYDQSYVSTFFITLAKQILQGNRTYMKDIYDKASEYQSNANLAKKCEFAIAEKDLELSPNASTALYLYANPIDLSAKNRITSVLVSLGKTQESRSQIMHYFMQLVDSANNTENFKKNSHESLEIVSRLGDVDSFKNIILHIIQVGKMKRFDPDFNDVFNMVHSFQLTSEIDIFGSLMARDRALTDEWIKYLSKNLIEIKYKDIAGILAASADRKTSKKIIQAFFKVIQNYQITYQVAFVREYLNSEFRDMQIISEMFEDIAKKGRKSNNALERDQIVKLFADIKEYPVSSEDLERMARVIDRLK